MKKFHTISSVKIIGVIILTLVICSGTAFSQQRMSVTSKIANIRSDAGTSSEVLWQVEKFHPFLILEKKGQWRRVRDFENDEAWIHKSLLGNVKSVITIKEKCNIRSKPTTKSSILFTAERGVPFRVITTKGKWLKVEHVDGDVGWIYKTLVW